MNKYKYKRLFNKGNNFKKSYFYYSKEHQKYIDFDKKHYQNEGDFLHSKFITYINVIPFSRPPFFFAMYLGTIVPQMLFLFKTMPDIDPKYANIFQAVLYITVSFALLNLFYWFFDLFIESNNIGKHNQKINASISYGFTIFMLSEVCIFAGLFWGFFDRAFHPSVVLQSLYMPSGTHGLPTLELVFKGSFLLSLSCTAFNAMKRCLMTGDNNRARFWGFTSLCIGLTFLFQQIDEYESLPYMMSLNAHCSFFYAITGLHGFHVAIGLLFIGTIVDRIEQEKFNQYELMSVTFAEIYWYFVDLVWFVLLIALYAYGVYHPTCVLQDKYTIIDEYKDLFFSFSYIYTDYIKDFYMTNELFNVDLSNKLLLIYREYCDVLYFSILFVVLFLKSPISSSISVSKLLIKKLYFLTNSSYYSFIFTYSLNKFKFLLLCFKNMLFTSPIKLIVSLLIGTVFYDILYLFYKGYSLISIYY